MAKSRVTCWFQFNVWRNAVAQNHQWSVTMYWLSGLRIRLGTCMLVQLGTSWQGTKHSPERVSLGLLITDHVVYATGYVRRQNFQRRTDWHDLSRFSSASNGPRCMWWKTHHRYGTPRSFHLTCAYHSPFLTPIAKKDTVRTVWFINYGMVPGKRPF